MGLIPVPISQCSKCHKCEYHGNICCLCLASGQSIVSMDGIFGLSILQYAVFCIVRSASKISFFGFCAFRASNKAWGKRNEGEDVVIAVIAKA